MLQGIYYNDVINGPNMELKYPVRAKKGREMLTVKDQAHANRLWTIRTKKYIFETLRGWTLQRKHAIAYSENTFYSDIIAKGYAIDKLLFTLISHYESSLSLLTLRISQHRQHIEKIAPFQGSRFYHHYNEVILPILEWCEEYQAWLKKQKESN